MDFGVLSAQGLGNKACNPPMNNTEKRQVTPRVDSEMKDRPDSQATSTPTPLLFY